MKKTHEFYYQNDFLMVTDNQKCIENNFFLFDEILTDRIDMNNIRTQKMQGFPEFIKYNELPKDCFFIQNHYFNIDETTLLYVPMEYQNEKLVIIDT